MMESQNMSRWYAPGFLRPALLFTRRVVMFWSMYRRIAHAGAAAMVMSLMLLGTAARSAIHGRFAVGARESGRDRASNAKP